MVIDFHYHFPYEPVNEAGLERRAQRLELFFGAQGRGGMAIRAPQILERLRIIMQPDPDASRLLRRMDEAGIDLTAVNVIDTWQGIATGSDLLATNKICADWVKQQPGRLIAFAGVDPRRRYAPDLLRRCIEDYGMKGLKWHPDLGFYPNGPEAYAMLAVAQELKIPLLMHSGPLPPPWRSKFTHPNLLDDMCLDFPELKVVAAHMGLNWWHDWAGLAQYRHNLFGDLAMWQYFAAGNYARFCRMLRDVVDWCGIGAVLFGTDAPGIEALVPNKEFIQAIRELPTRAPTGISFTQSEVDAILEGNARKLLGL